MNQAAFFELKDEKIAKQLNKIIALQRENREYLNTIEIKVGVIEFEERDSHVKPVLTYNGALLASLNKKIIENLSEIYKQYEELCAFGVFKRTS